ncbi:hypothetical protein DFH09DRAFT_1382183 [Mycena vulgaris]|nr:hypothetical protein DFH09DRAFT_1382183 [Mycena vulgaris]
MADGTGKAPVERVPSSRGNGNGRQPYLWLIVSLTAEPTNRHLVRHSRPGTPLANLKPPESGAGTAAAAIPLAINAPSDRDSEAPAFSPLQPALVKQLYSTSSATAPRDSEATAARANCARCINGDGDVPRAEDGTSLPTFAPAPCHKIDGSKGLIYTPATTIPPPIGVHRLRGPPRRIAPLRDAVELPQAMTYSRLNVAHRGRLVQIAPPAAPSDIDIFLLNTVRPFCSFVSL